MRTEVVTALKRQATKLLAGLHETKEPILTTEYGQSSAYLLDVADYELMVDRMKIPRRYSKSEQAIPDGRVMDMAQAKEKMNGSNNLDRARVR